MSGSISIVDLQSAASDMGPPIQISSEIGNVIEQTSCRGKFHAILRL
jgi:hypothetical protein